MADGTTQLLPPSLRGTLIGKEKITGGVVSLGALGLAGYGAYVALPFIASMMTNLLAICACALGVTVIGYGVLNKGMRSVFKLGFAVMTRKIHSFIVQTAPYDIANYVIACMKEKVGDGQKRLARIRGANQRTKAQIEHNEQEIQKRASLARAAESQGQKARKDAQLQMLANYQQTNERLQAQLEMQLKLTDTMQRGLEGAQLKVEMQEEAVKLAIETNSILLEGKEAAADVLAAISGDPEKKALLDEAMSAIALDSARSYGEIDQMMYDIQPILNDIELGKIVDVERGQKVLDSLGTKVELIGQSTSAKVAVPVLEAVHK